jgi:dihydropteroate synthase
LPAAALRLGDERLLLSPDQPLVMGIVNATPDSFSDGGLDRTVEQRVARAHALREAGAGIIDVGGESGVTDRPAVPAGEEIARVAPLVERLSADGVAVSVDTWKAAVARAALAAGAVMVNDPSGLRDPEMAAVCAESAASLVITHTRAAPKEKAFPRYHDVVADVVAFLADKLRTVAAAGVEPERTLLDPGIDLGKTPAQSIEVIRRLDEIAALGRPVLLAVSRKDFVGALTGRPPRERLAGTLAAVSAGAESGASVLRVHDVSEVVDLLRVRAALSGTRAVPPDLHLEEALRREPRAGEA